MVVHVILFFDRRLSVDCLPRGSRGREFCLERTLPRRWRVYRRPFNLTPLPWIILECPTQALGRGIGVSTTNVHNRGCLFRHDSISPSHDHVPAVSTLSGSSDVQSVSDRASLKSECSIINSVVTGNLSNIKPLSLHQQSMRVVDPTHTQHEHEDFQERKGPTNETICMYSGVGRCGGRVEKYINRMTRITHCHLFPGLVPLFSDKLMSLSKAQRSTHICLSTADK
jgi:hypothetical protein